MAVAAAHAFAVNRGLFGRVEFAAPPPSWSESVRKALDTPMSICVNGALLSYDWTELVSSEEIHVPPSFEGGSNSNFF